MRLLLVSYPLVDGKTRFQFNHNESKDSAIASANGSPTLSSDCTSLARSANQTYGIQGESIRMRVRAEVARYMLLRWSVVSSPDHALIHGHYRLWLKDPLERKAGARIPSPQ